MKTKTLLGLLTALLLAAAVTDARGFLRRLVNTTVNRLMITILPPGEANPSNMAVVESDMMRSSMTDQPAAHMMRAREAHDLATGRGVVVAVLDAGFDLEHPVFQDRLSPLAWDTLDRDPDVNDLGNGFDDYGEHTPDNAVGHGNFVAGMVLLAAPDATILPVRVMDDEGYGSNGSLLDGIRYAMDAGAHVVNISAQAAFLDNWEMRNLLDEAHARGVLVVASAGNDGKSGLGAIAGHPTTVSVGAVDDAAVVAEFSNSEGWREELTVHAPGVDLQGPMTRGAMGVWSGTSFSSGLASGAAALRLEREPWSAPDGLRERIAAATNAAHERDGRISRTGLVDLFQVVTR